MSSLKQQVQEYINEGYYERAIALLQTSNSPGAKVLIEKLKKKIDEDDRPSPAANGWKFNPFLAVIFFTLLLAVVGGGIYSVIANDRYQRDLEAKTEVRTALWDACIEKYDHLEYRKKYDLQLIVSGCSDAVDSIMTNSRTDADECATKYIDDKSVMATCIDLHTAGFTEDWIQQAN